MLKTSGAKVLFVRALVVLLLSTATHLSAQEILSMPLIDRGRARAIIYRGEAGERTGTSGWIVACEDSAFLFYNGVDTVWMEFSSVDRVDLFTASTSELPIVVLAGSTLLAGHILASLHEPQPEESYHNDRTSLTRYPVQDIAFGSLTIGLSAGLLTHVITRSGGETREEFNLKDADPSMLRNRLSDLLETKRRRFSVRVTAAGTVWGQGRGAIEQRQREGGFGYIQTIPSGMEEGIEYMWPRRIRLGYEFSPDIDLGLVMVNRDAPTIAGTFGIPHFPFDGKIWNIETAIAGTAFAPSIVLRPTGMKVGPEAGAAIGIADIRFHERTTGPDSVTREMITTDVEEQQWLPMALIHCHVSARLIAGLTVTGTVDLMFLPDLLPPPRRGGYPSEPVPIPLGSASIGVSLGYRF